MVSLCDAQFSIMLGEENNVQYWFVILPGLTRDNKEYVSQTIVCESIPNNKKYDNVVKEILNYGDNINYDDLPRLVIMYLDSRSDVNNPTIEFVTTHKKDYIADSVIKSVLLASRTISKLVLPFTAKTIVVNDDAISVKEAIIENSCLTMLKFVIVHLNERSKRGDTFAMYYEPYI